MRAMMARSLSWSWRSRSLELTLLTKSSTLRICDEDGNEWLPLVSYLTPKRRLVDLRTM